MEIGISFTGGPLFWIRGIINAVHENPDAAILVFRSPQIPCPQLHHLCIVFEDPTCLAGIENRLDLIVDIATPALDRTPEPTVRI